MSNLVAEGPVPIRYTLPNGEVTPFDTTLHYGNNGSAHLVLARRNPGETSIGVRFASECSLGQPVRSVLCDCGSQLRAVLGEMNERFDSNLLVYSFGGHEGRGAGPENHFRAYILHTRKRLSSGDAYRALGLNVDARHFEEPMQILRDLDLRNKTIRFKTNTPKKEVPLMTDGFRVRREPMEVPVTRWNAPQLQSRVGLGHNFSPDTKADIAHHGVLFANLEDLQQRGVDLSVNPERIADGINRYGPVQLPLAIHGRDKDSEIEVQSVYLYMCHGRPYYAVMASQQDFLETTNVAALTACIPGDNLASTHCNCRKQINHVMHGLVQRPQNSVMIYALSHHFPHENIPLEDVRSHLFRGFERLPIDINENSDAKIIIESLGIKNPEEWDYTK